MDGDCDEPVDIVWLVLVAVGLDVIVDMMVDLEDAEDEVTVDSLVKLVDVVERLDDEIPVVVEVMNEVDVEVLNEFVDVVD